MLRTIITISLISFLSISLLMYLFQRQLIYFPSKERPTLSAYGAEDMQELELKTADGQHLLAWYKPARAKMPTVLYLHGNAGHIGNRMTLVRQFLAEGFGVLLLEYRGFGGNEGSPTEAGLYKDAESAIQFLGVQHIALQQIVLYGESLGTAVAVRMASESPGCALVLQSPFTSLAAVARYHYPWLFIEPQDKFNSLALIPTLGVPLLILHGKADEVVPFKQGLQLYNAAKEPKKLIALENKGHDDLWDKTFAAEVIRFIHSKCS